ncbi:CbtA family protein [Mycolicibacterium fluoranthenivorans]|uniref:CbtA family protein n=1 Tax=Mycolicibacterium fluoranthenivorans TaxID=258505 RepID=A0A7G8PHR0_9MYCO|nr:CbtA family protein [Mycolicibacterium fluoranthenivorans]QNJ93876.1 CbtA family protein [Mycolicibacterium fluoranthenivorans]
MPLSGDARTAIGYLAPGVTAGLVASAFSWMIIEPLIGAAVTYEGAREHAEYQLVGGADHDHGHELFTRAVQENVGSAVGIVGFGMAMGVLFAVAHNVVRRMLARHAYRPDGTGLALLVAAGMFTVIAVAPGLKYPANPPTVGLEDTIDARSSAFLTMTAISIVAAGAAVAFGLAWARRWGGWRACGVAVAAYTAVVLTAMVLLPSFHEVPASIVGPDGRLLLDGFPAEVLGEFRVYSLVNQALMWLVIGATWATLAARGSSARRRATAADLKVLEAG